MTADELDPVIVADRAAVQRRTLRVLWLSSVLSRGAISSIFPVSVLAIRDLLGSETWAGLSTGMSTIGSALGAAVLAAVMQRRGRNFGLTGGFAVGLVGTIVSIVAIQSGLLLVFLIGMVLSGFGFGTANLSRYAAADLATDERRSRDIGSVIFASTFGAVFFPLFIGVAGDIAADAGFDENTGGFFMGTFFFALTALAIWTFMRPDPLLVARRDADLPVDTDARKVGFAEAISIAWSNPLARLAFVALVLSQAVMVGVMAMTPLHMEAHGHAKGVIGQVISAHTAGMFAFAPLAGRLSDGIGRVRTIVLAGFTLALATVLTALAGEAPKLLMFPGLFLLGLGWSFGIVAGSALLTESVPEDDRVAVQGAADVATSLASGLGALSSGVILSMTGFHILSLIGMGAAAVLLGQSWFEHRLAGTR